MQRVLLIGTGYLGQLVASFASRLTSDLDLQIASHEPGAHIRVDLADSSTFSTMRDFNVVVDCADATVRDPGSAAEFCVRNGISFVETSADSKVLQNLCTKFRAKHGNGQACLILGAGIFPGLSTLLLADVARRVGDKSDVRLGIRVSPFSHLRQNLRAGFSFTSGGVFVL